MCLPFILLLLNLCHAQEQAKRVCSIGSSVAADAAGIVAGLDAAPAATSEAMPVADTCVVMLE